jgi:hypothetical protein
VIGSGAWRPAITLLTKAVGLAYGNGDDFRSEMALDSPRVRPDFQLLMMDQAFPAEPFSKGREANH